MKTRTPVAWSNMWLQRMSWKDLCDLRRMFNQLSDIHGIGVSRRRRVEAEWRRRKREGAGGLAAPGALEAFVEETRTT